MHGEGHCGTAEADTDCAADDAGSWVLSHAEARSWASAGEACSQRCLGCARCWFVSYSLRRRDCSWFRDCAMNELRHDVSGFRSAAIRPKVQRV